MPGVIEILVAAGGISALVAAFRVVAERRKLRAEASSHDATAAETITGTAVGLLVPLRAEITAQTAALAAAEDRVAHLRAEILARDVRLYDQAERLAAAQSRIAELAFELTETRARYREDNP